MSSGSGTSTEINRAGATWCSPSLVIRDPFTREPECSAGASIDVTIDGKLFTRTWVSGDGSTFTEYFGPGGSVAPYDPVIVLMLAGNAAATAPTSISIPGK